MKDEYLDEEAACAFIGGTRPIHPSTLWRNVKSGRYSRPIKISKQAVRWRRSELLADLDRLVSERKPHE